jgi:hypothetical protein
MCEYPRALAAPFTSSNSAECAGYLPHRIGDVSRGEILADGDQLFDEKGTELRGEVLEGVEQQSVDARVEDGFVSAEKRRQLGNRF